jgi:hypothetical protein
MTLVYIVYDDEHEVTGVFESLPDAIMRASEEEAIVKSRYTVAPVFITPASKKHDHLLDPQSTYSLDYRFPESCFSEHAKHMLEEKRRLNKEMDIRWQQAETDEKRIHLEEYMAKTNDPSIYHTLIDALSDMRYHNVSHQLIDGHITLLEYKHRQQHIKYLTKALTEDIVATGCHSIYIAQFIKGLLQTHGYLP